MYNVGDCDGGGCSVLSESKRRLCYLYHIYRLRYVPEYSPFRRLNPARDPISQRTKARRLRRFVYSRIELVVHQSQPTSKDNPFARSSWLLDLPEFVHRPPPTFFIGASFSGVRSVPEVEVSVCLFFSRFLYYSSVVPKDQNTTGSWQAQPLFYH